MYAFFLLVVCTVLGFAAPADRLFLVSFRRPLTRPLLRHIEHVLGYNCTEYVEPNSLILYLTEPLHEKLHLYFGTDVAAQRPLLASELCAENLQLSNTVVPQFPRIYRNGTVRSVATTFGGVIGLKVLLHPGALANGASMRQSCEAMETVLDKQGQSYRMAEFGSDTVHLLDVSQDKFVDMATELAAVSGVSWIEPLYAPQLANLWGAHTAQKLVGGISGTSFSNALQCADDPACAPFWNAGVRGANQLIAISDTGCAVGACANVDSQPVPFGSSSAIPADTNHRKFRAYRTSTGDQLDSDGHGTHVCGSAAGNAAGQAGGDNSIDAADFRGTAPDARLVFIDIQQGSGGLNIPSPYDTNLLDYAWRAGARIHSGSWGIADFRYSDEDRRVDLFLWEHRTFVCIFAAGNSGDSRGPNSILSPGLAKNALAVGAAMTGATAYSLGATRQYNEDAYAFDWVASFSSRGGAAQHARWPKPNILGAGGQYVWSSDADSTSCGSSSLIGIAGTSMAAPQVAGAVALLRQYFMDEFYHPAQSADAFEPTASLVHCLIANSGRASRGVFPQQFMHTVVDDSAYATYERMFIEGYGRIDLSAALPLPDSGNALSLAVLANEAAHTEMSSAGQVHRYCVSVETSGNTYVSVTLAWTDYPSSLSGTPTLVNDLDLSVYVRDHNNGLVATLHPNGLTERDSRSPQERSTLQHLIAAGGRLGLHIEVRAAKIGFLGQSYSLAVNVNNLDSTLAEEAPVLRLEGTLMPPVHAILPNTAAGDVCMFCATQFRSDCTTPPPTLQPTAQPTLQPTHPPVFTPQPTVQPIVPPTPQPTSSQCPPANCPPPVCSTPVPSTPQPTPTRPPRPTPDTASRTLNSWSRLLAAILLLLWVCA